MLAEASCSLGTCFKAEVLGSMASAVTVDFGGGGVGMTKVGFFLHGPSSSTLLSDSTSGR